MNLKLIHFAVIGISFSVNGDLCRCVGASDQARSRYLAVLQCMSDLKLY